MRILALMLLIVTSVYADDSHTAYGELPDSGAALAKNCKLILRLFANEPVSCEESARATFTFGYFQGHLEIVRALQAAKLAQRTVDFPPDGFHVKELIGPFILCMEKNPDLAKQPAFVALWRFATEYYEERKAGKVPGVKP